MNIARCRIVDYTLTDLDALQVNRRRTNSESIRVRMAAGTWPEGVQAHVGNPARGGQTVPLLVVVVHPFDRVNGQAFMDGNDQLWVQSAEFSNAPGVPGTWAWPQRKGDNA